MSYAGSEAVSLAYTEGSQALEREWRRPSLEVLEGAGLDARARQGVSTDFLSMVSKAVAAVLVIVCLGACRVGLCSLTLGTLQATSELRSEIKQAQALETDLKVARSVLSDTSRIDRIAVENYGMVKTAEYETISIGLVDEAGHEEQAATAEAPVMQASADNEEAEPLMTTMRAPVEEPDADGADQSGRTAAVDPTASA